MARFTRELNEERYVIPQRFADDTFKTCPFCGTDEPAWLTAYKYKGLMKHYLIKCSKCSSVMCISEADITGLSYTTASIQGQMKKNSGKDARTNYVKIEEVGLGIEDPAVLRLEKREMSIEDLKEYSEKISK